VLFIDEVDKAGNNELFLEFLAMLRDKYLKAKNKKDFTFHSVILAGVHDVKTLKQKIKAKAQEPSDEKQFNSPWNIAIDFEVDMSFNPQEISTMLTEYCQETGYKMNIEEISNRLYHWTSGYPFLVSKLCKTIDEKLLPNKRTPHLPPPTGVGEADWTVADVDTSTKLLLRESNAMFDDITKNLENNKDLYNFMQALVLGQEEISFIQTVPLINLANMYGLIRCNGNNKVKIHNKVFEEVITSYLIGKNETENTKNRITSSQDLYVKEDGRLDFEQVLLNFQKTIKAKYGNKDLLKSKEFLEENLRMQFLLYLQPIINGVGFSYKEVEIGAEKRLDVIVLFKDEKFIVELKIWHGEKLHEQGKKQLLKYMEIESINKGYMLILNKNKEKDFTHEIEDGIMMVYV
jgi:hypothetical protein